jgi:hypothetical protein
LRLLPFPPFPPLRLLPLPLLPFPPLPSTFSLLVMTGVVFGVWSFGWPAIGDGGGTVDRAVTTTAG